MNTIKFNSNGILEDFIEYGSFHDNILTVFDSKIIDFIVYDHNGSQVLVPKQYSEENNSVDVDLSEFDISGTWTAQKLIVQQGASAEQPLSASDFTQLEYLLHLNNQYAPLHRSKNPIPVANIQDIPFVGQQFYASGTQQLINGRSIVATIPASGENRQYVGTSRTNKDCLHHFQVWSGQQIVLEAILDSQDFDQGGVNLGQIYYFPQNLKAYDEFGNRKEYNWRARISYKEISSSENSWPDNLIWSEWSQFFTFKVNIPPGTPFELRVD